MATDTTAAPLPCYLLKLPPELRLQIYGYCSDQPSLCASFAILDEVFMEDQYGKGPGLKSIMRTCKTIHAEASSAFYDNISVKLDVESGLVRLNERSVPAKKLGRLRECAFLRHVRVVELKLYDSLNTAHVRRNLVRRLKGLLDVLNECRNVKTLSIVLRVDHDDDTIVSDLLAALKVIECKGIVAARATSGVREVVGASRLAELARSLHGEFRLEIVKPGRA